MTDKTPDGWAHDELSRFLDLTRAHQFQSFEHLSGSYRRIRDIDAVFLKLGEHLDNPPNLISPLFVYRSHSAFRAAAGLILAGQVPETYMVARGCLEFALYGLYFAKKPQAFDTWLRRDEGPGEKKEARREFPVGNLLDVLRLADRRCAEVASALYERTIDLGAHPNQLSVFSSMSQTEDKEQFAFDTNYIMADSPPLRLALRSVSQVGVCALDVLRCVFRERFDLIGLTSELRRIRKGL